MVLCSVVCLLLFLLCVLDSQQMKVDPFSQFLAVRMQNT